jgi:serine/threonine-protein kinase
VSVSAYQLEAGSLIADRYRVERKLSQGGMGAIYVARHEGTGRRIALKVMHPRYVADARSRERFAQEARLGAMIESDHVVEVFDAGVDDERAIPYLAMELLEGETVASRLTRVGRGRGLSLAEVHEVLRQLCSALAAAHARNIVHRDLKPENLFLVPKADAPFGFTLKVLDFGIAKLLDPSRAAQNVTTAIGTPLWMAPEQNTTAELTPATDVWAVGLIAFRLLTGRFYWRGAAGRELDMAMLLAELERERLPPASERARELGVADDLPGALDPWFMRCIARDPGSRYRDGAELAQALALSFGPLLQRPSLAPRSLTAETQPALADSSVSRTRPIPQAPTPPIGPLATQDVPQAPLSPIPAMTVTGQPGVPYHYPSRASVDPSVAKPRWWMAAVPALVILGGLLTLAVWQGVFDAEPHARERRPDGSAATPVQVPVAMPLPAVAPVPTPTAQDVPWRRRPGQKEERDE